jgi:hypothetical protein
MLLPAPVRNFLVALKGTEIAGFLMAEQRVNAVVLLQSLQRFNAFSVGQCNACVAARASELARHIVQGFDNKAPMAEAKVRVVLL